MKKMIETKTSIHIGIAFASVVSGIASSLTAVSLAKPIFDNIGIAVSLLGAATLAFALFAAWSLSSERHDENEDENDDHQRVITGR